MNIKKYLHGLTRGRTPSPIQFVEQPLLRGVVNVRAFDFSKGVEIANYTNHNLLMYNERDIIIELLGSILLGSTTYAQDNGGLSPAGNRRWLKWFGVGEGVVAPARTNLALGTSLAMLVITTYGSKAKVGAALQINISIPTTDGGGIVDTSLNGHTLSEIGLFTIAANENAPGVPGPTGSEVLFSRQVHPGIPKTNAIQIDYQYSILLT